MDKTSLLAELIIVTIYLVCYRDGIEPHWLVASQSQYLDRLCIFSPTWTKLLHKAGIVSTPVYLNSDICSLHVTALLLTLEVRKIFVLSFTFLFSWFFNSNIYVTLQEVLGFLPLGLIFKHGVDCVLPVKNSFDSHVLLWRDSRACWKGVR